MDGSREVVEVGKDKGTPGEHEQPLPPYQLTPNLHLPLGYCNRGCCNHSAAPFSFNCTDAARNRALALSFGLSAQNPFPPACVCERDAHDQCCFKQDTPPPPSTLHHCRLTQQARNQAIVAWFWVLSPQPPHPACVCKCTAPPPPRPHLRHTTTFSHPLHCCFTRRA